MHLEGRDIMELDNLIKSLLNSKPAAADKKVLVSIRLDTSSHAKLVKLSAELSLSKSRCAEELLRAAIDDAIDTIEFAQQCESAKVNVKYDDEILSPFGRPSV
jgi:hypothetical protein